MVWWAWIVLGIACMAIEVHFTHDFSFFAPAPVRSSLPRSPRWERRAALVPVDHLRGCRSLSCSRLRKLSIGTFQGSSRAEPTFNTSVGEVATPDEDRGQCRRPRRVAGFELERAQYRVGRRQGPALPRRESDGLTDPAEGRIKRQSRAAEQSGRAERQSRAAEQSGRAERKSRAAEQSGRAERQSRAAEQSGRAERQSRAAEQSGRAERQSRAAEQSGRAERQSRAAEQSGRAERQSRAGVWDSDGRIADD